MKNKYFFMFALLLLSSVSFISAEWNSTLNDGLEVYYNLNDTFFTELVYGVYNGSNYGNVISTIGKMENGSFFDGSSAITTPYYPPLSNNSKSFSVWFNSSTANNNWIFSSGSNSVGAGAYGLAIFNDGSLYFQTNAYDLKIAQSFTLNEFHHVSCTWDGSTNICYFDGVNTANSTDVLNTQQDFVLTIGMSQFGGDYFNGVVDELAIWNRSLTSDEVINLYNSGNGITYNATQTPEPPTLKTNIETCQDLQNIENYLDEDYVLANDINCSGFDFTPLSLFTGSLDGQGYAINDLYVHADGNYVGLTSYSSGASFKNLTFNSIDVRGGLYVGGIGGDIQNSIIENVHVNGLVDGSGEIGGLIGASYSNVSIKHSSFSGDILAYSSSDVGGIIGYMGGSPQKSSIENSYVFASIVGQEVGGIVGYQDVNADVLNSFYDGEITCEGNCGGIASYFYGYIESSYSKGTLNGGASGGIISSGEGKISENYGLINNTYTFMNLTGSPAGGVFYNYNFNSEQGQITNTYVGGYVFGSSDPDSGSYGAYPVGENNYTSNYYIEDRSDVERAFSSYFSQSAPYPTNLTVEQMMFQSSFLEFDFNNVWTICTKENSSYSFPYLQWQTDVTCEDIQEEVTPPQFTGTGLAIYNVLEGSGAGLGIFMQTLGKGLPLLLIGLAFVVVIVVIFKPVGKMIESSHEIFKTFGR